MESVVKKTVSVLKTLLDIMLPPVCYVCGKSCSSKYGLCDGCFQKIKPITPPYCPKCGRRITRAETVCQECRAKTSHVEKAWSCCYHEDIMKECIHLFKYKGYLGLTDIFGDIMKDFVAKNGICNNIDVIVPVPIFATKKRERSYNHAEILARALSKAFSISIDTKNLKKIRWTQSQSELDKYERLKNVRDTFLAIDKNAFSGKNVLLVDDVYTTGATINECARMLLKANARKVYSLTLTRGV